MFILFSFVWMGLAGCQTLSTPTEVDYPKELRDVQGMIERQHYKDARQHIDTYLNRSENIQYFGHAYFLKGYIFELEGDLAETESQYKQAIQHSSRFNSLVEAKALYNLSFTYERMDRFDKLMTVLRDLVPRSQYFRPMTSKVEIPARMGAAMMSLGQGADGKSYHEQARTSYSQISRGRGYKANREDHSRALYYLGATVYEQKNETFVSLRDKLQLGQRYLVACAESSIGSWSRKGTEALTGAYQRMWNFVQTYEPKISRQDALAFQRHKHGVQLEMASQFYDLLKEVRPAEFPMRNVNRYAKAVMDDADKWVERLESFARGLRLGPETLRTIALRQTPLTEYLSRPEAAAAKTSSQILGEQSLEGSESAVVNPGLGGKALLGQSAAPKEAKSLDEKNKRDLQKAVNNQLEKGEQVRKMQRTRKDQFRALPEKDPNL